MSSSSSLGVGHEIPYAGHIIVFNESVRAHEVHQHTRTLRSRHGVMANHVFDHSVCGLSTRRLSPTQIQQLLSQPNNQIERIELDLEVKAVAQTIPWGVNRIGVTANPSIIDASSNNLNIHVFVLDTGVSNISDLRLVESRSYCSLESSTNDLNGHGTMCASVIGARDNGIQVVGVCPGAMIHSYKVLNSQGRGYLSDVVRAVNAVISWKQANPTLPAVINLSLGAFTGTPSYNVADVAIQTAINTYGITVCVAAGNDGIDAALTSPAHCVEAITCGAYSSMNQMPSWSNYGPLVDINAPGVNILAINHRNRLVAVSGTSFAAPHVVGACADYLWKYPTQTPSQVRSALLSLAANPSNATISVPLNTTQLSVYVKNL